MAAGEAVGEAAAPAGEAVGEVAAPAGEVAAPAGEVAAPPGEAAAPAPLPGGDPSADEACPWEALAVVAPEPPAVLAEVRLALHRRVAPHRRRVGAACSPSIPVVRGLKLARSSVGLLVTVARGLGRAHANLDRMVLQGGYGARGGDSTKLSRTL